MEQPRNNTSGRGEARSSELHALRDLALLIFLFFLFFFLFFHILPYCLVCRVVQNRILLFLATQLDARSQPNTANDSRAALFTQRIQIASQPCRG